MEEGLPELPLEVWMIILRHVHLSFTQQFLKRYRDEVKNTAHEQFWLTKPQRWVMPVYGECNCWFAYDHSREIIKYLHIGGRNPCHDCKLCRKLDIQLHGEGW